MSIGVNGGTLATCAGATTCGASFDTTTLSDVAGTIVASGAVTVSVNVTDAYFATVECLLDGTSLGVSTSPTFSQTVSLAGVPDGTSTVTCNVRDKAGNLSSQSVAFTVRRLTLEIEPHTLNLRQSHGDGGGRGRRYVDSAPPGRTGARPRRTGRVAGPALSGAPSEDGAAVRLRFDRAAVVASVRAGIALGKIDPTRRVVVHLYAGDRDVGSDLVSLVGTTRTPCPGD